MCRTFLSEAYLLKQPLEYLLRIVGVLIELIRTQKQLRDAGALGNDGGQHVLGRNVRARRKVVGISENLLAFLRQNKVNQEQRRMGVTHAPWNDHRAGGAGDRVHELGVDGRALSLADQRMMREYVQCDRKL